MMIIPLLLLAATAAPAPLAVPSARAPEDGAVASAPRAVVDPAIIEMTYNAFVAVEESPEIGEIVRPAVITRIGHERVIVGASAAKPIS